jgi:hypothetical protein
MSCELLLRRPVTDRTIDRLPSIVVASAQLTGCHYKWILYFEPALPVTALNSLDDGNALVSENSHSQW